MIKKLLALSLVIALAFSFSACDDDDDNNNNNSSLSPKQEQWAFAINYTATWCGHCGDWGAPLIHDMNAEGRTLAICSHGSSDPMNNPLYSDFQTDRPSGGGIPSFWVGDSKSSSSSGISDVQNLKAQVATAGIDMKYGISGGNATVQVAVKFFEAGAGDYYLSVYVLEDGIDGSSSAGSYKQSGTSSSYPNDDYEHNFVLRASNVDGKAYGEMIVTDPAAGKTISKTYDIPVDASWDQELYVGAILWKKDGSGSPQYKFVNAYKKK